MSSKSREYYLIFDTNVLYHPYDKKGDFTNFCFSGTYENVIGFINQLDIYEHVALLIPEVVWCEMENQIIEAHNIKLREVKEKVSKYIFPEIIVKEQDEVIYSDYIHKIIDNYKSSLSTNINTIINLPIASEIRYRSLIKRAFEKHPPFEGKDKKSDKGFKDALLWESILEFATQHPASQYIYYSKDNAFGEYLQQEFEENFPNSKLIICSNETIVKEQLENWAKAIDIYSYIPINRYYENKELIDWIESSDFQIQLIDRDFGLLEKNNLVTQTILNLHSYDNIQIIQQANDVTLYSIDAILNVIYQLKNSTEIKETIEVTINIECILEELYTIEDIYRTDEEYIDSLKET